MMVMMMDVIEMMVENQADLVVHMEVDNVTKELEKMDQEPDEGLERAPMILIRFIAARVRKTFHELHLLTPSLLFLPANQVSVGYGDKI